MSRKRNGRRIGLRIKLNAILIACILLISIGLMAITYWVYGSKVDSLYKEKAGLAARAFSENYIAYQYVTHLREVVETDEFQQVRARALAAENEGLIKDWMRQQPPPASYLKYFEKEDPMLDEDGDAYYSLYGIYKTLQRDLADMKRMYNVDSVYLQYYADGVTYTLVDPDAGMMAIGEPEEPIEVFSQYVGNVQIPPTVYQYRNRWLCTACEPIYDYNADDESVLVGMACVDLDMNDVYQERLWFLVNSAVFVAMLTLTAMATSMLLTRKVVTKPLRMLSKEAVSFAREEGDGLSMDVLSLPIRSNDEIGDLYHEIQSMQRRIVDGADRLARVTAERERVSTELRMATEIQSSMLPNSFPPYPNRKDFDLYASMDPAKEVGGDFYDFFLIDDDHLCVLIADVSDKGVPAALFMMSAKILIKYRAQMGGTPGEILTEVNAEISKNNKSKMFVTVWMGILDVRTGAITCTNAGHEFPFIRDGEGVFRVLRDKHGLLAGVVGKAKYTDYELTLMPGDAIFVYTDGVPEANNAAGEMYGMERLEAALNRTDGQSPEGILRVVRSDVDAFVDGAKQFDDLTMLCLEYRGAEA